MKAGPLEAQFQNPIFSWYYSFKWEETRLYFLAAEENLFDPHGLIGIKPRCVCRALLPALPSTCSSIHHQRVRLGPHKVSCNCYIMAGEFPAIRWSPRLCIDAIICSDLTPEAIFLAIIRRKLIFFPVTDSAQLLWFLPGHAEGIGLRYLIR